MRSKYIIIGILSVFLAVSYMYNSTQKNEIAASLIEHTLVIAEPMWNYDSGRIEKYLEAVTDRYNYQSLKLLNDDNVVILEFATNKSRNTQLLLSRMGLIPKVIFEHEIHFENTYLGRIVVIWNDTSIYFYSYAFIVSLLLIVITRLHSRVRNAKKDLEIKIVEIEKTMTELQNQKDYIEGVFNVIPEGLITFD